MTVAEFFAAMLALLVIGLVWLILGGPGVLCAVAAMVVGNVDVSWIDELLEAQNAGLIPIAGDSGAALGGDGAKTNVVPLKRKVS